jgi:hypothetical protein
LVSFYERPFRLKRQEFDPQEVFFCFDKRLAGVLTWAHQICAEDSNGNTLFIISTELGVWKESQLSDIESAIKEQLKKEVKGKKEFSG